MTTASIAIPPRAAAGSMWPIVATAVSLAAWFAVYWRLESFSNWAVAQMPITPDSHPQEAVSFFIFNTPKVLMLLALVAFAMGVVRSFFSPERTRAFLAGKRKGLGNAAAAGLGTFTLFCSCSAVPLFVGFVSAGVPLGVTFSFLIASLMINEVALGLLLALLGWKIALIYLGFGLAVSILAGWVIGRLHLEGWIERWVLDVRSGSADLPSEHLTIADRIHAGIEAVRDIFGRIWVWIIVGIAAGALIHGYVPAEMLAGIMGGDHWWSVPAAVFVGIPIYSNAAGIIPVVEAFLGKNAALGTVLAFMMAATALSAPEMIILSKVLTARLIAVFIGVVTICIVVVGFLFNALFT